MISNVSNATKPFIYSIFVCITAANHCLQYRRHRSHRQTADGTAMQLRFHDLLPLLHIIFFIKQIFLNLICYFN